MAKINLYTATVKQLEKWLSSKDGLLRMKADMELDRRNRCLSRGESPNAILEIQAIRCEKWAAYEEDYVKSHGGDIYGVAARARKEAIEARELADEVARGQ